MKKQILSTRVLSTKNKEALLADIAQQDFVLLATYLQSAIDQFPNDSEAQ
jgi:hypothetical protein